MGLLSPTKLLLLVLLVLLLFGARRLSSLGTGLGEGIRNFKKGLRGDDDNNSKGDSGDDKQLKG